MGAKSGKKRIKKVLYFFAGVFVGVCAYLATLFCRRRGNAKNITDGFKTIGDELGGVRQGLDTAKGDLAELKQSVDSLNQSTDRSRDKIDECRQALDRIRKKYRQ